MIKHTFPDKLGILKASKNNCSSLKALIVGTPLLLLKGVGGVGSFKNWVTWGGTKILLERGENLKKVGVDIEREGGCHFFISLQFNCIYCV